MKRQFYKLDAMDRLDWKPKKFGARWIVVDAEGRTVCDAQGYGFKNEARCLAWIKNQQRQAGLEV